MHSAGTWRNVGDNFRVCIPLSHRYFITREGVLSIARANGDRGGKNKAGA